MILTKTLNKWSIKKQLMFLVLAPLVLIASLSTTNNIYQAVNATNAEIGYIGSHAAKTAASLAELNMFAGNINELNTLGRATVNGDHIEAIVFLQPDKKTLSLTSRNQTTIKFNTNLSGISKPVKEKNLWYFSEPITLTGIEFNDFNTVATTDTTADQIIGWALIVVNEDKLIKRLWSTILMSIAINGIAALIAGLLAWLLANEITRSLANIIITVKNLIKGDFHSRVIEKSGGEMGALEYGINELAYQAGKSQQTLTKDINKATQKLQKAMLKLETHNTELTIAKEDAEIANQAKDMFLARMSHELRTPLATVLGFSKLLRTTNQNKKQAEHTSVIMQASTLLLSIIDDILEFSKLQSSTITLEHINFDLESCLDEVIALHSLSVHEKNIALVLLIESDVPLQLKADKLRIQQMVSNLVSNAIKFTTHGHVVVMVSIIKEQAEYVNLQISVIDSGEGISNHNMSKLFKPFAQADTSISRRHGGTGLGLVIVKSFATLMNGTLHLESKLSKGTEAILSIQCNKQQIQISPNTPVAPVRLNTIIIYDQNAWVRRFFRDRLRSHSKNIFVVSNISALNSLLVQHAGDCQLLIIGLGVQECATNQSEVYLSNIRQIYSGPIMLTAGHPNPDKIISDELRHQLQPIIYLSKPISGHNLRSAITDCIMLEPKMVIKAWDNKNTATYEVLPYALQNSLKSLDILVVEDNELNLQLIRTILEIEGACTWPALNGVKAIDSCATKTFDVILMDVHLPLIDGIEASKQIRKNTPNANTPIIALTANVVDTEEKALLEAGVFCICYKPIDEHKLIKSIHHAVKRNGSFFTLSDEPIITISKEQLATEIYKQITAIEAALCNYDWILIKDISHQLLGLTGLTLFKQTSQIIKILDNAAQEQNKKIVTEQLLLLKTIINKHNLLNLDEI